MRIRLRSHYPFGRTKAEAAARKRRRRPGRPGRSADYALAALLLLTVALAAAVLGGVNTETRHGAAEIVDGDSLVIGGQRIRLIGIDAPELSQRCGAAGRETACGRRARALLVRLVGGRRVDCEGWQYDRYGRLLARCRAGTVELNREMVRAGWAVAYGEYAQEEAQAARAAKGIWASEFTEPQAWRRQRRGNDDASPSVLVLIRRTIGRLSGEGSVK